jgi:hypothetical protein
MSTRGAWRVLNPHKSNDLPGTAQRDILLEPNNFEELKNMITKILRSSITTNLVLTYRLYKQTQAEDMSSHNNVGNRFDNFRREWVQVRHILFRRGYNCKFPLSEIGPEYQEFMI